MWTIVAWVILAGLATVSVTAMFGVSSRTLLAIAHDGLPYLLIQAWPITLLAAGQSNWPLAAAGVVLVSYHLALMIPRIRRDHVPRWVAHAPRIDLTVSNVYVDNDTPDAIAAQLIASDADVIVVAEWNDRFEAAFNAAGAEQSYPHRLCNDCDNPAYVITVASRIPLTEESTVDTVGDLIISRAVVMCGSRSLSILAVHPVAVLESGGFDLWKAQLDALLAYIPSVDGPFVIAGDFNSTRFRPEFQRLLDAGLIDAHDTLGRGLSPSFQLAAKGALAATGGVIRLDHALLSDGVWPVAARDLDSGGSDHVPFVATLAVRPNTNVRGAGDTEPTMSRSPM